MATIICPFITCGHNTSNIIGHPGECKYAGYIPFGVYEDENEEQYLHCPMYYRGNTVKLPEGVSWVASNTLHLR